MSTPVSYIERMRAFRDGAKPRRIAASPIAVNRSYAKHESLTKYLTDKYESCSVSNAARRYRGQRRKSYCAGVAWTVAKRSGRFSDYSGFAEETEMAKRGRKKSARSKAKKRLNRKRNALGHFVKKTKVRRAKPRRAAPRRAARRVSKPKPMKRSRRRARRALEEPMKKRSRRRRRSRAREALPVVYETPNPKKPKRKAGKRKSAKRSAAAKKAARTRRRNSGRARTAVVGASIRRRVKRKGKRGSRTVSRPGLIKIQLVGLGGGRRRAGKRKSTRKGSSKRKAGRRKGKKRGISAAGLKRHYEKVYGLRENPAGYAMENPMTGGELALGFVSAGIGIVIGEMVDRLLATHAKDDKTATLPNSTLTSSKPDLVRIGAQVVLTAAPLGLGIWANSKGHSMAAAALQGMGIGIGARLVQQLVTHFVLAPMLKGNDWGDRLLSAEMSADAAADAAAKAPKPATGAAGYLGYAPRQQPLFGMGQPRVARFDPGPRAGVGAAGEPAFDPTPRGGRPDGNPQFMPPMGGSPGPSNCTPCSAESAAAGLANAVDSAMREGGGGCGTGAPPDQKFRPLSGWAKDDVG